MRINHGMTVAIFIVGMVLHCSRNVVGTSDETVIKSARVYSSNLTPAANVKVHVYGVNDTTRIPVYQTTTDNAGSYSVEVGSGVYNVLIGSDLEGAFQDSVQFTEQYSTLADDTLGTTGVIKGKIVIEPVHDPRTAMVQVVGTNKFANVASDGSFTIPGLPAGKFVLRGTSTVSEYTPTYLGVTMAPDVVDTVEVSLVLIFTGIPVVKNLQVSYDSLANIVSLTWDTIDYFLLDEFVVYSKSSGEDDFTILGNSRSCSYTYKEGAFGGSLNYRVAIKSKTLAIGPTVETVSVFLQEPVSVRLVDTIVSYLGKPYTLHAEITGSRGAPCTYEWDLDGSGTFVTGSGPDTTFIVSGDFIVNRKCAVRVVIDGRITLTDSVSLTVMPSWEKLSDPFSVNLIGYDVLAGRDRIFVFCAGNDKPESVWSSTDGINWTQLLERLDIEPNHSKPVLFKDSIIIVDKNGSLWKSADAVTWKSTVIAECSTLVKLNGAIAGPGNEQVAPNIYVLHDTLFLQSVQVSRAPDSTIFSVDMSIWRGSDKKLGTDIRGCKGSDEILFFWGSRDMFTYNWWGGFLEGDTIRHIRPYDNMSTEQWEVYRARWVLTLTTTALRAYDDVTMTWVETPLSQQILDGKNSSALVVYKNKLHIINSKGVFRIVD